jgi:hypothetical protein
MTAGLVDGLTIGPPGTCVRGSAALRPTDPWPAAGTPSAIRRFIDTYNQRCEPFKWTTTADQILTKAVRPKTSDTRH